MARDKGFRERQLQVSVRLGYYALGESSGSVVVGAVAITGGSCASPVRWPNVPATELRISHYCRKVSRAAASLNHTLRGSSPRFPTTEFQHRGKAAQ